MSKIEGGCADGEVETSRLPLVVSNDGGPESGASATAAGEGTSAAVNEDWFGAMLTEDIAAPVGGVAAALAADTGAFAAGAGGAEPTGLPGTGGVVATPAPSPPSTAWRGTATAPAMPAGCPETWGVIAGVPVPGDALVVGAS